MKKIFLLLFFPVAALGATPHLGDSVSYIGKSLEYTNHGLPLSEKVQYDYAIISNDLTSGLSLVRSSYMNFATGTTQVSESFESYGNLLQSYLTRDTATYCANQAAFGYAAVLEKIRAAGHDIQCCRETDTNTDGAITEIWRSSDVPFALVRSETRYYFNGNLNRMDSMELIKFNIGTEKK